ncbi:MAG TPA: ankyrin repeat domain-containing protein [Candidatus Atribacteria bacterium]|nr:ankyrin repeat domain-containing protein [Candidatus Atribacteria bacterium]
MKKTLIVGLIACIILIGSSLALRQEDFTELVKTGSLEEVKKAIEAGANVNARDENGMTPLMHAAGANQNPEVIKVLLEAGAEVNARDEDGWTPLMQAACFNQNPEVIKVLLEAGADGKIRCKEGKTAFDYAKENKHLRNTEVYWLLKDAQYL